MALTVRRPALLPWIAERESHGDRMPQAYKHDAYSRGLYVIWAVVLVLVGAATYLPAKTPDLLAGWVDLFPSWLPLSGQETNAIACGDVEAAQLWRAVFAVLWPLALLGILLSIVWLQVVGWRASLVKPEGARLDSDLLMIVMVTGMIVIGTVLSLLPDPSWPCDQLGKPDLFLTVMITLTFGVSTMAFPAASRCFAWSIGRYRYVESPSSTALHGAATVAPRSSPIAHAGLWIAAFFAVSWAMSLLSLAVPVVGKALLSVFRLPVVWLMMMRVTDRRGPACPISEQAEINAAVGLLASLATALSVAFVLFHGRTFARLLREARHSPLSGFLKFHIRSQTVIAVIGVLFLWPAMTISLFAPQTTNSLSAVCSAVEPATWQSVTRSHFMGFIFVCLILQPILWLLSYVVRSKAPS